MTKRPFVNRLIMMAEQQAGKDDPQDRKSSQHSINLDNGDKKSMPDAVNPKESKLPILNHWKGKSNKQICFEVSYVVLGMFTMLLSVAVIIVAILSSVANKLYDAEQSGHLISMVVLAVTSAITLSVIIYSIIGVCRTHTKPLYMTAFTLVIIALIQALIAGIAVNVTAADELTIGKALSDSFRLTLEGNQKHVKLWASTQHELQCCGLYGPEDYRMDIPTFFPPRIPVSCCRNYDSGRSDYSQERERELCRAHRDYHPNGCNIPVVEVFKSSAIAVVTAVSLLIIFEVITSILAAVMSVRKKGGKGNLTPETPDDQKHES